MDSVVVGVREQTDAAEARRRAMRLASDSSFDDTEAGNLGLVVTEAAKNLVKHSGGGSVILRALERDGRRGVEMLAVDKGPGMRDIGRTFQDGYSTAGTSGTGLGAIARLSTIHDIFSRPEQGTVLMSQIWRRDGAAGRRMERFRIGGIGIALPGQPVCGDDWTVQEGASGVRIVMADGLGHGAPAADAAGTAIRTAREHSGDPAARLLERIHTALRPTRGAAVAMAEVDTAARVVRFSGIGNIAGSVVPNSGPMRHMVSHAGTAGHEMRKVQEFTYPWDAGSLLVMHSDGLQTRWSLDAYPGLAGRHPSVIAGVLYRDFVRGRDDVTVVVAQEAGPFQ